MGVFVRRATVGIVLAVVMALAGTGAAQAAWSGVGSLDSGRYNHTATLLNDGRVLVTGGNNNGPLDSAELYHPATNGWSKAAPMNYARHGHAAVLLNDGRVSSWPVASRPRPTPPRPAATPARRRSTTRSRTRGRRPRA